MAYTNNETLMEQNVFQLPMLTANDAEFSKDDLAEDRDGMQLSLPRVKIPSGGALQFELPGSDPKNPHYAKTLEGVILFQHAACAYWQEGSEYDDNATPLCSSVDGKVGIGTPGGTCASCEFNQFRSASDGKAKACKNMRHLYLLRSGDYIPLQVVLPPTSLRPYQDFYNLAFALRNRAIYGSVVQIGLKRADNGTNIYSVATFKKLYDFTGEQLAQITEVATQFREQIKMMLQQRAADAENRSEDGDLEASGYKVVEGGEDAFCITSDALDGDRDELPL